MRTVTLPTQLSILRVARTDAGYTPDDIDRIVNAIQQLQSLVGGGLTLGDGTQSSQAGNFNGQIINYAFAAAATLYKIPHGLGRTPNFAILGLPSAGLQVYDPLMGANWSPRNIELYSSAIGTAKLLVL